MTQDQFRQILVMRKCMDTILDCLRQDLPDKDWQEEKKLKEEDLWKDQK